MPNRQFKIDREALKANQFAILGNKKKMAQLSSEELLAIAEMLDAETGYSTARLKDKLRGYIQNKIDRTLKGEIAKDEGFEALAHAKGTARQSEAVRRREKKAEEARPKDEPKPIEEKAFPQPKAEAEIEIEDKRAAILHNKREEHKKSLMANDFAILNSKKKMEALSSEDLCLLEGALSEKMAETKKNTRAQNVLNRQYNILCSFAQNRIQSVLKGEKAADEGFDDLVSKTGTYQQKEVLRRRKKDTVVKSEPEVVVKPAQAAQKTKVAEDKPKEEVAKPAPKKKDSWYKRHLKAITVGLSFVVLAAAASVSGAFKKVFGGPEQDTKPATEKVATPKKVVQQKAETKTATNFQDVRSELQKAKDNLSLAKIQAFKESQKKLNISLDKLDEVVEKAVKDGKIKLADDLTPARAKYVISFYAQYPGTEAGQACKALLNGEDVDLSNFNKWDKALGEDGSEFAKTLDKKTDFSAMDNASKQTKQDFQKAKQTYNNLINQR